MGRRKKLWNPRVSQKLYRLARGVNDVEAVVSGNPLRLGRRVRNKLVGRWLFSPKRGGRIWRNWLQ